MAQLNLKLQLGPMGFVTLDVGMVKATNERKPVEFKRLHGGPILENGKPKLDPGGNPIKCYGETGVKNYCKGCGANDLTTADFTKGIEHAKGKYVEVTQQELDTLKVPTNGLIEVLEVVGEDQLTKRPEFLSGSVYYLQPPTKSRQPANTFALLRASLETQKSVMFGRTSMYGKEDTVAIQATKHGFRLYVMRYPSEIRQEQETSLPGVDQRQLKMLCQVLDALTVPEPTLNYVDQWAQGVAKLRDDKLAGIVTVTTTAQVEQPIQVSNIEDDLAKTLAAIKARKAQPKPPEPAADEAKPAKKGKKGKAA